MSMNFSQHVRTVSALLILAASVTSVQAQSSTAQAPYYQTISIDTVLKTKPAVIYVSPKYQVTIKVNGREITGVSLELAKQKLFSVTLAENRKMIFLDALATKGGADLNLILDDEEVLPIHLIVKDQPSGTRIYTFDGGQSSDEDVSAPASASGPVTPAPTLPATPAPAPTAPVKAPAGALPNAAPQAFSASTSTLSALPPQDTQAAARMDVKVARQGADATLTLRLSSPAGRALRADLSNLRLFDGMKNVTYSVQKSPRGRLLPVETTVKISNAPQQLIVSWPVTGIYPVGQYTLKTPVRVD